MAAQDLSMAERILLNIPGRPDTLVSQKPRELQRRHMQDSLYTNVMKRITWFLMKMGSSDHILHGCGEYTVLKLAHQLVGLLRQTECQDGVG